jgi:serine/threonine-protein kinase
MLLRAVRRRNPWQPGARRINRFPEPFPVTNPKDPLPRRFGRYLLFDKIGEGGMARIYLARTETELGAERLLVVKQILPMLSSSDEFSRLLVEEAKLAAQLSHGNIVQVFDLGRERDSLYIAMEYVEGFDLRELLVRCSKTKTPLPAEFALLVVREALRGLSYAHRKADEAGEPLGIVHRDVSPSNVLISFDGEVKLCDFGIARAIGINTKLSREAIQGKAGYMSPEAASGQEIDERADVFSAGVILWELLAGRRLYKGQKGKPPTLEQATKAEIPPLRERGYKDEERLHAIVRRALAREPERRFSNADAFLVALEEYSVNAGLLVSPLRLGHWLVERFGHEIRERRRARERAAKALQRGPLLELKRPGAARPESRSTPASGTEAAPFELSRRAATNARARPEGGARPWMLALLATLLIGTLLGWLYWSGPS